MRCFIVLLSCLMSPALADGPSTGALVATDAIADPVTRQLVEQARGEGRAWSKLSSLCTDVGHRLSGSSGMEKAVRWAESTMAAEGLTKVWTEPVQVPHWVRGAEKLSMLSPQVRELSMLGLGSSVGTPGVEAEVVVVDDWEQLGPHVKGKIVLYNVPMPEGVPAGPHYGATVGYRLRGADKAAAHGAVGMLIRSITTRSLYTPHTGTLYYSGKQPRIPGAAITVEDAELIARMIASRQRVRLRLEMGAQTHKDAQSHNVLAEIRGSDRPEQVVLIGAHLDSWDVGCGAHDDGAGVVEVMEAMRLIALQEGAPRRTIRAVLFTNEENGTRGGKSYASEHEGEQHVAAIECDLGGGRPLSWGASGTAAQMAWLRAAAAPLGLPVNDGGGGADIRPLKDQGTLLIGMRPDDSHYFDIHHTRADTLDKVDPQALSEATAALVSLTWALANAED
jgi:hypothetical protein